ncbi:MAG: phospholipase A2 [Candidatus Ratteibacteria bacterium]
MRVIYKLWIILIFAGVITAWAGPSLSVTLDKTTPYDGATRKNETISTKARVQSYTNDNLQEELDQGGYVEYKYYFQYSSGQGGMVSTPISNPTAFIRSKTCNTSGCFSGPVGSGWIRVTVTARTCDKNGTEIPGSVATKTASIKVDVIEVSAINVNKNHNCIQRNFTFTAVTNPTGYGNLVNWSGGGTPATGSGSNFITQWSWGEKTVTALNKNKTVDVTFAELADWDEYLACGDLMQYPNKAKVTDGCSWAPENPAGGEHTNFHEACVNHDYCYRECAETKSSCDSVFKNDMLTICTLAAQKGDDEEIIVACFYYASLYYNALLNDWLTISTIAYRKAQIAYCVCCD